MASFSLILFSGLALCGHALRKDLKLESSINLASVHHLTSLIQQHAGHKLSSSAQEALQMLQSSVESGEVPADLADALETVVSSIDTDVKNSIISHHNNTRDELRLDLNQLEATTIAAVEKKNLADSVDQTYISCVQAELNKLTAALAAEAKLASASDEAEAACKIRDDWRVFEYQPETDLSVDCTFSDSSCDTDFNAFSSAIDGISTSLSSAVKDYDAKFTEADDECKKLNAAKETAKTEAERLRGEFEAQKAACVTARQNSNTAMCRFGIKLQDKCVAADEMQSLIAKTNSDDVEHSHTDRTDAWTSASRVRCMLNKVIAGSAVDDALVNGCQNAGNYDEDIGVFDRLIDEKNTFMTAEKFTCTETSIVFSGKTWEISLSDPPVPSEYEKVDYEPKVDLVKGNKPFTFCT